MAELDLITEPFSLNAWILKDSKTTMRKNAHISFPWDALTSLQPRLMIAKHLT